MPNISIVNETGDTMRMSLGIGTAALYYDNNVHNGGSFKANVASILYSCEFCQLKAGNEFSSADSLSRAGMMAGAVASGTASVIVGSMWALGSFGGHFAFPGRAALGAAGGLWAGAIKGGSEFARLRDGLVLKVDVLVGFSESKYALRLEKEGCYRLVLL